MAFSSQWRDRAGLTPASLFSPDSGHPDAYLLQRSVQRADTNTRFHGVSIHSPSVVVSDVQTTHRRGQDLYETVVFHDVS